MTSEPGFHISSWLELVPIWSAHMSPGSVGIGHVVELHHRWQIMRGIRPHLQSTICFLVGVDERIHIAYLQNDTGLIQAGREAELLIESVDGF